MTTVTSIAGDQLDALIEARYGRVDSLVLAAVLAANPGLAAHGPVLPAGVAVALPAVSRPKPTLRFWP